MNLKRLDIQLFLVTSALVAVGLLMVGSVGQLPGADGGPAGSYLPGQLWKLLPGVALLLVFWRVGAARLVKLAKPALIVGFLLLLLTLFQGVGTESSGARRWLTLGLFSFQPAEVLKLFLLLYLADTLSRRRNRLESFKRGMLPPLLVVGAACGLLLLQPDLSTALLLFVTALAMFWIAGVPGRHLAVSLAVIVPVVILLVYLEPYRWARITAFLDPWRDAQAGGYQIVQSLLAIGSGGLTGVGLGASQQKLFYLPEAHTDFIFSILGEELGLLGTLGVLALFVALVVIGLRIVRRVRDPFSRLLALGVTVWLGVQALINIGVVTGLLPTTGLPLPFISYGGTSLVSGLAAVGILAGAARETAESRPAEVGEPLERPAVRRAESSGESRESKKLRRSPARTFGRPAPRPVTGSAYLARSRTAASRDWRVSRRARKGSGTSHSRKGFSRPFGEVYARADRRRRWR